MPAYIREFGSLAIPPLTAILIALSTQFFFACANCRLRFAMVDGGGRERRSPCRRASGLPVTGTVHRRAAGHAGEAGRRHRRVLRLARDGDLLRQLHGPEVEPFISKWNQLRSPVASTTLDNLKIPGAGSRGDLRGRDDTSCGCPHDRGGRHRMAVPGATQERPPRRRSGSPSEQTL